MASEIHGGRGYVYCLRYQVVWCVKNSVRRKYN